MSRANSQPPRLLNIANILTGFRIVLVPAVLVFLWLVKPESREVNWLELTPVSPQGLNRLFCVLAGVLFVLASLTDLLDGWLARKYQLVTNLGKLLDPLADKILVLGTMVMLVELNRLPGWMVVVILARELAITSLRSIVSSEGIVISASQLGKYKTFFQVLSLGFIIIYYPIGRINIYAIGMVFFVVAFIFTLWSGADYFYRFWSVLKKKGS